MADDQNRNDRLSYESDKSFFDNLAKWAQQINSARDPDVMSASTYEFYRKHGHDHDAAVAQADALTGRLQERMNRTGHTANVLSYTNPFTGPARVMSDVVASEGDPAKLVASTPIGGMSDFVAGTAERGAEKVKDYLGYASGGSVVDRALHIARQRFANGGDALARWQDLHSAADRQLAKSAQMFGPQGSGNLPTLGQQPIPPVDPLRVGYNAPNAFQYSPPQQGGNPAAIEPPIYNPSYDGSGGGGDGLSSSYEGDTSTPAGPMSSTSTGPSGQPGSTPGFSFNGAPIGPVEVSDLPSPNAQPFSPANPAAPQAANPYGALVGPNQIAQPDQPDQPANPYGALVGPSPAAMQATAPAATATTPGVQAATFAAPPAFATPDQLEDNPGLTGPTSPAAAMNATYGVMGLMDSSEDDAAAQAAAEAAANNAAAMDAGFSDGSIGGEGYGGGSWGGGVGGTTGGGLSDGSIGGESYGGGSWGDSSSSDSSSSDSSSSSSDGSSGSDGGGDGGGGDGGGGEKRGGFIGMHHRVLHRADGGIVDKALEAVGGQQLDPVATAQQALAAPRPALSKGQQQLMGTFQQENRPAAVVSPKPGTGSTENTPGWSFATPDQPGEDRPPPMQAPVRDKPRLSNIADHVQKQMKARGFRDLVRDVAGIHKMDVTPTTGSWMGQVEPSFIINGYGPNGEEATPAQIRKLSHLLGFGYQQDAIVEHHHNPSIDDGVPTMYVGKGRKLVNSDLDAIHAAAQNHGLNFTRTKDGMGVKFSHYGDKKDTPEQAEQKHNEFMDKVKSVADQTGMPDRLHVRTAGDLKYAKGYLDEIFGGAGGEEGVSSGSTRSPDLFGRVVDHVLAPYARASAAEGYRLSPERLGETYGLSPEEIDRVRKALYPVKGSDRSTVALMKEGPDAEQLDVRPTGKNGKPVVDDVLYALQNRAARQGQIDPTDHSDSAKKMIAKNMADEVEHHVGNSDKSAIGWYDAELKKAKDKYAVVFPEIKKDPQKSLLFDTILGITSQGNDVHSNSVFAARLYNLVRDGKMSLKDATEQQAGTMGEQTKAIEYNLHKLHHLLENNSHEELSSMLDKKQTVSDWNKQLKADKSLHNFDGNPLSVDGRADQKVTGWSVFGPKIGSFINNLRGDYSTLTADLWFSRSWNRLLGHNFLHTPLQEAAQYRDFRDAMHAEYAHHHPDEMSPVQPNKTRQGKVATDAEGNPQPWLHGSDMKNMNRDEFDAHINDPELMLEKATEIYNKYSSPNKETGKGAFAEKSDLRRRAKNWVESRYNPVAAPRSDQERGFQQDTAEEAQKMLKKRGIDISIADIQAALWYHEKDLFGKYGVAGSRQAPASYSDAADKAVQLHQSGRLYDNWSDIQKEIKASQKAARDEERAKVKAEKDAQKAADKAAKAAAKAKPVPTLEDGFARGGMTRMHPALKIPGVHIRTAEAGEPLFHGEK